MWTSAHAFTAGAVVFVLSGAVLGSPRTSFAADPDRRVVDAMKRQDIAEVRALVDAKADVTSRESLLQQTALMWAVSERHHGVVRLLLARGADVGARSINRGAGRSRSGVSVAPTPVEIGTGGSGGFTALLLAARVGDDD